MALGPGPAAQLLGSLVSDVSPPDPDVYPIRFNAPSRRGDLINISIIHLP